METQKGEIQRKMLSCSNALRARGCVCVSRMAEISVIVFFHYVLLVQRFSAINGILIVYSLCFPSMVQSSN